MNKRAIKGAVAGAVVALAASGGVWWWCAEQRAAVIEPGIRRAPDLQGRPEELRRLVAEAQGRARAGSTRALGELSRLYHANGYLAEVMPCYTVLEQLQPEEPRWPHRHATILAGFGETEPALSRWRKAIALAPEYLPARLRLGDMLLKSNQLDEAASVYAEALRRKPDEPHALLGIARLDVEAGRWPQARERLEKVVAQTRYTLGYDLIVTVYEQLGMQARAGRVRGQSKASGAYRDLDDPWMLELLDECFDPYQLAVAAGVAHRTGQSPHAIRLLERAVSLAPGGAALRFQLAGVYADTGDRKNARAQLERCTTTQPGFADAWAHLSALLESSGEPDAAQRTVAAGLRHAPDSPGLHLMRARFERRAGRTANAIAAYRRSIQLRPNEADPQVELATLLLQTERAKDAIQHLHQALEAEPEHPMALSLLALSSISAGDEPAARRWLGRVRAQPRISAAQAQQLHAAYRGQFGREFR